MMTRTVTRAVFPPGLAAWLAVGVALTVSARLQAEPLVNRFRPGAPPGSPAGDRTGEGPAGFAVAPGGQPPVVSVRAPRRRRTDRNLEALQAAFLREGGVENLTLFFGYFGAFLPPAGQDPIPTTTPTPPSPVVDSFPPPLPPAPAPRVPLLQPFVPQQAPLPQAPPPQAPPPQAPPPQAPPPQALPPQAPPPPNETPEPATLLSGLLGAGLAGLVAWKRRRQRDKVKG
jgi:LPXTG-motif cell wall-anchored protein